MWKRLQGQSREKQPAKRIGNPVLIETTYDEKSLGRYANISDLNSPTSPQHQQPYHEPPGIGSQLPSLPYQSLAPHSSRDNRISEAPTASSVYSQPSPGLNYDWSEWNDPPAKYSDVSPPTSPIMQPRVLPDARDISPLRDDSLGRKPQPYRGSHIPVPRKAPGQPISNPGRGRTTSNTIHWDEMTGEPTSSYAGKPAQVVPGTFPGQVEKPSGRSLGYQVSVTSGHPKLKKSSNSLFASKEKQAEPKPREEWRGASGRMAIVQPLTDKRTKSPLTIPGRDHRRPSPGTTDDSGRSTPTSAATTVRRLPFGPDTSQVSLSHKGSDMHDAPIKPTLPLKVEGRTSPPRSLASPISANPQNYAYPSPITPSVQPPYNPAPPSQNPYSSQQSSGGPKIKIHRRSIDSNYSASGGLNKDDKVPTSRFSWTTYATNTTYQHSPPPSPPPPMRTSSLATASPTPAAPSVLNRRRPVAPASTVTTPTSRKPLTPTTGGTARVISHSHTPSTSTDRSSKALPLPPGSFDPADHISVLEAAQEDLRVRRQNLARLVQDLNATQPQNPLVTDYRKVREAEERKKGFMAELDDIKREEYEVGLKLHRAWKKREREEPEMGSAFWIRRVTG